MTDPVRAIADAVLYEGYVLWPYRRSALKNQRRWTFGGVYPRAHSEGREDDPWTMRTEVLVEGGAQTRLDVQVRFLHVVAREIFEATANGLHRVDELVAGDARHVAWDEAAEREAEATGLALGAHRRLAIAVPSGSEEEPVPGGALVRRWETLEGTVEIGSEPVAGGVHRLHVEIANTSPFAGDDREAALRQSFCSAHTVLRVRDGAFVSATDPPEGLASEAAACHNEGAWPVLLGEPGSRDTMLSSPIILEDHPRIAPESPGDLFDGGEIDQMLTLNILAMTDEERAEMRAADPRTREILERTEALSEHELMALHGTIREFGLARRR